MDNNPVAIGCVISVALSVGFPRPAVSGHPGPVVLGLSSACSAGGTISLTVHDGCTVPISTVVCAATARPPRVAIVTQQLWYVSISTSKTDVLR